MIDKKKMCTLAALSASSMVYAMGTPVHADSNVGVVTALSLNMRSGPSVENSVIGNLKKGEEVEIVSSQDGWLKVKYGIKTGWVSESYISVKNSSTTTSNNSTDSTTTIKRVTATMGLNVRKGGAISYSKIGYINRNNTVDVIGVASTGWYKVKLDDGTVGYASNKYLTDASNNSGGTSNSTLGSTSNNISSNVTVIDSLVVTANLNVRSGPSTSDSIVGLLYKGQNAQIVEHTNNSWYKVKLSNGKVGYCAAAYLKSQSSIDSATNKPSSESDVAYTIKVKSYAYYTGTITATGTKPTEGRTIAVDPTIIPYGTRIYIPEFDKTFIAEDCGGGIKGHKIDIYMTTKQKCINWGVRELTLYILK